MIADIKIVTADDKNILDITASSIAFSKKKVFQIPGKQLRHDESCWARRLIEKSIEWCRSKGCSDVEVIMTPEGEAMDGLSKFYKRFGFARPAVQFQSDVFWTFVQNELLHSAWCDIGKKYALQ